MKFPSQSVREGRPYARTVTTTIILSSRRSRQQNHTPTNPTLSRRQKSGDRVSVRQDFFNKIFLHPPPSIPFYELLLFQSLVVLNFVPIMFSSLRQSSLRVMRSTVGAQLNMSTGKTYKHILSEVRGKVGLITLNRPKALNALCDELLEEVIDAGKAFDKDSNIGAIVITGVLLIFIVLHQFGLALFIINVHRFREGICCWRRH